MKKLLLLLLFIPFVSFGQIQTSEFKSGYERGYKKAFLKKNGKNYNGSLNFNTVYTWIEIDDFLMGSTYTSQEKEKNYERGFYTGYFDLCLCSCGPGYGLGIRRDMRKFEKIQKNISKNRKKIDNLKIKLAKTNNQNDKKIFLRDIDSFQERIRLIMSSCNEFLK